MAEGKQSKGPLRRWLDKRREPQRRGAEITERAKAARRPGLRARRPARQPRLGRSWRRGVKQPRSSATARTWSLVPVAAFERLDSWS
jgi:hypothetical protein